MVITPDRQILIVAESIGRRLTAYSIDARGDLSDRRVFADGLDGPPDGICLNADGGVWTAISLAHLFERIVADRHTGHVTHCIDIGDRAAIVCMLGGAADRTLFMLSSSDVYPERLIGTRLSRVESWIKPTVRLVDGETMTPLQRLFAVADRANGTGSKLDIAKWTFLNNDLVVHVHRIPEGQWVGIRAENNYGPDGIGTTVGTLFDETGAVGSIAQSVLVRRRPG